MTSDTANVRTTPAQEAASRPPFTRDRCFRSALSAVMSAPPVMTCATARCFASSESPSAGAAINAEAPPDRRHSNPSSGGTAAARASARRAPSKLPSVANGWPPTTNGTSAGQSAGRTGPMTRTSPSGAGGFAASAWNRPAAAFPTAITCQRPMPGWSAATSDDALASSRCGDTASIAARTMASASARRT